MASPTRVRVKRRPMAEINVVPYIDVMLVLLVVFMIAAPMLTQGIKVELPETDSKPLNVKDQQPLIVSVKRDQTYYLNLGKQKKSATSLEDITHKVEVVIRNQPDRLVLVEGDARVPYGAVVSLMASLQQAGVTNVGLITEPPSTRKK